MRSLPRQSAPTPAGIHGLASMLLLCASTASANDTLYAGGFEPVWVAGYHVGYESGMYPTNKVDFAAMSHVIIGPVTPNTNGTLNSGFRPRRPRNDERKG